MNLLKGILQNVDEEVQVEFNESNVSFSFKNFSLTCRLIDGKYPNYEAVIPDQNPNRLTIERNSFLQSIKRVSILNKGNFKI